MCKLLQKVIVVLWFDQAQCGNQGGGRLEYSEGRGSKTHHLQGRKRRLSVSSGLRKYTLLQMGRYYNTTMCHYWDMLVK